MRLFSSTKIIQIDFQKFFLLNEAVHTHRRFDFPALVLPSPDPRMLQLLVDFFCTFPAASGKSGLLHFVERDQVHVTEHPGEFLLQKLPCSLGCDLATQGVFNVTVPSFPGYSRAVCKSCKRIRPVYRHHPPALPRHAQGTARFYGNLLQIAGCPAGSRWSTLSYAGS